MGWFNPTPTQLGKQVVTFCFPVALLAARSSLKRFPRQEGLP